MQINFIHGTNYSSAPSWLTGAGGVLDQIQSFYDHLFTNNITINVTLNWVPLQWSQTSTHEGGVLADNNLTSGTQGVTSSFSTLSAALVSHEANAIQTEAYDNMPTSGVSSVYIAPGEAMVLGLETKQTVNIFVNVNSSANWLGADGFGILDAFGAISHEITETGMGRISHLSGALDTMDMFRFSGGAHDLTTGATSSSTINSSSYFSIDGGATNLGTWPNDPGQGDFGDWTQGGGPVPNDAYGTVGTGESHISEVDLELMNVLGWGVAVVTSGVWSKFNSGQTIDGYTVMSGGLMTVSSGATASGTIYTDATYFDDNAVAPGSSAGADAAGFIAGTEISATVDGGGLEFVDAGGYASATHVSAWGSIADLGEVESAVVSAHGLLNVDAGGYAYNTSVLSGGVVSVVASGASNNTSVFSGGTLRIVAGGSGTADKILNGGQDYVYGLTVLDVVSSGGTETIEAGGSAGLDAVDAGGTQIVAAGGVSDVTFVYGAQEVYGVASGAFVSGGPANQYIESGGSSVSATLSATGYQYVSSGGYASATTVSATTQQRVDSGGVASGTIVSSGGVVELYAGGTGYALNVSSGGFVGGGGVLLEHTLDAGTVSGVTVGGPYIDELEVLSGGVASNVTVIITEDYLQVDIGGSAVGTVLESHAYALVYGTTTGTTVSSGSTEYVASGGDAISTTVSSGGYGNVAFDSFATSTTVLSGGTVSLASGGTGYALTVSAGGVVDGPGVLLLHTTDAGTVSGVTVGGPDTDELEVLAGGVASNVTVIVTEDFLQVDVGGTATGTVLTTSAYDLVYGSTLSTTVSSGSVEYIRSGGVVSAGTISNGGIEYVSSGQAVSTTFPAAGTSSCAPAGPRSGRWWPAAARRSSPPAAPPAGPPC